MKKYIGFLVLASLMLSLSVASFANAEDFAEKTRTRDELKDRREALKEDAKTKREEFKEGVKANRENFKEGVKANREEFKEKMKTERKAFLDKLKTERTAFLAEVKAKRDEWKTAKAERKAEFCRKAGEMFTNRFEFAIAQLTKHQTRVGELIEKLKAEGKDTTLATESLNLSKQKLADAKTKLAEIKTLLPEGGCENMTPEIFEKIKLGARDAKNLLKESREELKQAVKELKALKAEDDTDDSDDSDDDQSTQ